jgi:sulfide dehydrogenase cytochrome subunit
MDRGAVLALSCAGCHGPEARGANGIPSLRGRDAPYIARALTEFRSGARAATVMGRIATGYDDAEIEALARHFGRLD